MNLAETLRSRKGDWSRNSYLAPLDTVFENALSFMGATRAKREELAKRGTLTEKGIADELRAFADKGMTPTLRQARERIESAKAVMHSKRVALAKPKVDPTDVAAAILRQDMRAHLRAMGSGVALGTLLGDKTSPDMLAAVLEAPPELSGLNANQMEQITATYLERAFPNEVAEMRTADEGLALLSSLVTAAESDVQSGITGR